MHHLQPVQLPWPVMNHDFALTTKHMVFVIDPIVASFGRVVLGLQSFGESLRWDPSKPTHIVLVPRDGGKPRMVETDPFFHFHVNNAFEDGGDTVVDLVRYDDYSIGANSLREFRTGGFDEPVGALAAARQADGEIESHAALPAARASSRSTTGGAARPGHRYAYMAAGKLGIVASGIVKVDHEARAGPLHEFGEGHVAGEPIFVPRSPDSAEDDGWLLSGRLLGGRAPLAAGRARRARRGVGPGRGRAPAPPRAARVPRHLHRAGWRLPPRRLPRRLRVREAAVSAAASAARRRAGSSRRSASGSRRCEARAPRTPPACRGAAGRGCWRRARRATPAAAPPSSGVSNVPGAIVLTRMPRLARSRAAGSVRPTMPPFDAE